MQNIAKHPNPTAMWQAVKWLALACLVLVAVAMCQGCTRPDPKSAEPSADSSIVALVRQTVEWQDAPDSFESTGHYRLTWETYCNAFALQRGAELALVTAAHCVPTDSGEVRYLPPDGWGIDRARVSRIARGVAVLTIARRGGLVGFRQAQAPELGAAVWAISSAWGEFRSGVLTDAQPWGGYRTTIGVEHGWSGSPALDAQGRAWGVVTKCETWKGSCVAHGSAVWGLL